MWEQLLRFRALDAQARALLLRSSVLLPVICVSLRLRGFAATQAVLGRFLPSPCGMDCQGLDEATRVARTVRMVRASAHYGVGRRTCLEKSLALWWLLGRQGIRSSLRFGGRKKAGEFEAHAWVEYNGATLDDLAERDEPYLVFDEAVSAQPPRA